MNIRFDKLTATFTEQQEKQFDQLSSGDLFSASPEAFDQVFVRTRDFIDANNKIKYNCVSVINGELGYFSSGCKVVTYK